MKIGESAAQCIERLCFSDGGLLKNEFDNLYNAIFHKPEAHLQIVKTLVKHPCGMERIELLKQAKITNSGNATKILDELIVTGYVEYRVRGI